MRPLLSAPSIPQGIFFLKYIWHFSVWEYHTCAVCSVLCCAVNVHNNTYLIYNLHIKHARTRLSCQKMHLKCLFANTHMYLIIIVSVILFFISQKFSFAACIIFLGSWPNDEWGCYVVGWMVHPFLLFFLFLLRSRYITCFFKQQRKISAIFVHVFLFILVRKFSQ